MGTLFQSKGRSLLQHIPPMLEEEKDIVPRAQLSEGRMVDDEEKTKEQPLAILE